MKLRTALLVAITLLVAAIVGATAFAVVHVIGNAERRDLASSLERSRHVFEDMLDSRMATLRADCHVVANEPRLRATVATQDISRETVLGVISELRTSIGSDLLLLTDGQGLLVADTSQPDAEGYDMSKDAVIASALAKGDGAAVWIAPDKRAYQVHGCRIDFGDHTVGVVAIGQAFDDAAAKVVHLQTGSSVIVAIDGRTTASSPLSGGGHVPAEVPGATSNVRPDLAEVDIAGQPYAVIGGPFPAYAGKHALTYALARSLDEALAPGRRLAHTIVLIAAVALLAGLVLIVLLSRRLSRPVDALVAFTRRIAAGQLESRAQPSGATEVKALAVAMNTMVAELEKSRKELAAKERLEREMEIAMRIQTSMLPRTFDVRGLDIAARMVPASEVGGDYYDVLPVADGCWIGVGDVAGHGLTAGLEMLMVQSVVAALVCENPAATPKQHLTVLNHVVYENIRHRLNQDEHITLTLLRFQEGAVTFAGAHEEIVVCRAGTEPCECVPTPGTWLGAMPNIERVTKDTRLELATGDLMVLYSDGITEARNAKGEQYGMDRLCRTIEAHRGDSVEAIRDAIFAEVQAWQVAHDDDLSLVVIRRA